MRKRRLRLCSRASVLVGLLWCLALLSVVVIGVLHTAGLELRVIKNYGDQVQAQYFALAGIEKAKALLYQDALERRRSARNHGGELVDDSRDFQDVPLGRGLFSVIHQGRPEEGGRLMYGVSDEESRLNLNQASPEALAKLEGMTPEVAAAIGDWKDKDNAASPGGAEAEYYASQRPPSLPRNGPFQTVRELGMVRGVPPALFVGEDANQNGLLDPAEDDGRASFPPDNADGLLDAGWSESLTVDSAVRNLDAAGQERVNVQSADEKTLSGVPGISPELAKAIVGYRGQNRLENLADLLEVTAVAPQNPGTGSPSPPPNANVQVVTRGGPAPQSAPANSGSASPGSASPGSASPGSRSVGPKLIDETLLMEIADHVTVKDGNQPGAVNINSASAVVLACLPGVSRELAQAIVRYRKSAGYFPNIAWLLKVDGMTRDIFKQLAPRVTARSETFRILSEGRVPSSGATRRIQVIVRLGTGSIDTLAYREDEL